MYDLPQDPVVEGLPDLFPEAGAPDFVAETLAELRGEPVDARAGRVEYVRYWPAEGCVVSWSFPGADGARWLVSGRLFSGGAGRRLARRPSFLARAQGVGAPSHRYLEKRKLLLLAFPLDGMLAGLPAASSEEWVRKRVGPALGLPPASVTRVERQALNFKPWRRCVFRYRLHHAGGVTGCYAKVFRDDRGKALYERSVAVCRGLEAGGAPWDTPRPVAYLPDEGIVLFEELEGAEEVGELVARAARSGTGRARLLRVMERAGALPADLREVAVDGLPRIRPQDILAELRRRAAGIERVADELADAIDQSLARLDAAARKGEPEPLVPTHAAFRYDQLVCCGDRLALLDLDGLCLSGRSADCGYFLGVLDAAARRRPRRRKLFAECADAFLVGARRRGDPDPGWLAWFRAAALVKKVTRTFLSLDPRWRAAATDLEAGAAGILERRVA